MEDIEKFLHTEDFYDEVINRKMDEDIKTFHLYTALEIFRKRFLRILFLDNIQTLSYYEMNVIVNVLFEYVEQTSNFDKILNFEPITFIQFYWMELKAIREIDVNNLNRNEKKELKKYVVFLESNTNRFSQVDLLKSTEKPFYTSFVRLIDGKLDKVATKAHKLETSLNNTLEMIDNNFLNYLIQFNENEMQEKTNINKITSFDFEYFRDPILLQEFEEDKRLYFRYLKTYIKDALQTRKEAFKLNKLPSIYEFFDDYANGLYLTEAALKTNSPQFKEKEVSINENYPKSIFETAADYDLFLHLIGFATNTAQLSFIYRMMAEKERPAKILVKDTPFRDWFNRQPFNLKLDSHTKTFINAENEDRKMHYNAVNKLISRK